MSLIDSMLREVKGFVCVVTAKAIGYSAGEGAGTMLRIVPRLRNP